MDQEADQEADEADAEAANEDKDGDEADDNDDAPELPGSNTPCSSNSRKRGSSTSTTASSPNKKSKSPAVAAMDWFMSETATFMFKRNELFQNQMHYRSKWLEAQLHMREKMENLRLNSRSEKIKHVQQLARRCGVKETDTKLWAAVFKIVQSEVNMDFFIGHETDEGRMSFVKQVAGVETSTFCLNYVISLFM